MQFRSIRSWPGQLVSLCVLVIVFLLLMHKTIEFVTAADKGIDGVLSVNGALRNAAAEYLDNGALLKAEQDENHLFDNSTVTDNELHLSLSDTNDMETNSPVETWYGASENMSMWNNIEDDSDSPSEEHIVNNSQTLAHNETMNEVLERNPFLEPPSGCSVRVLKSQSELDEYLRTTNPDNVTCTSKLVNEATLQKNKFYSEGAWFIPDATWENTSNNSKLFPRGCTFQSMTPHVLQQCITKQKLKYVLISGDSNSHLAHFMLVEFFKRRSMKCVAIREEKQNDDDYLTVPSVPNPWRRRGCPICTSHRYRCTHNTNSSPVTVVEYIGMPRMWDKFIKYRGSDDGILNDTNYVEPTTFQQYLLWYYFPYRGFPDFWIILPPIHYRDLTVQNVLSDMQQFASAFSEHAPVSTRLAILSHLRFCLDPDIDWTQHDFAIDPNHLYHALNQIIYDGFKALITNHRIVSFLDLMNVLCPFSCNWNRGNAHLIDDFYSFVIEHVFSLVCA